MRGNSTRTCWWIEKVIQQDRLFEEAQQAGVEKAAQAVLAARALFPDSSLADLYDPIAMPPALAKAHATLDLAVDRCYRKEPFHSDRDRVEYLFALYEKLAAPLILAKKPRKSKS